MEDTPKKEEDMKGSVKQFSSKSKPVATILITEIRVHKHNTFHPRLIGDSNMRNKRTNLYPNHTNISNLLFLFLLLFVYLDYWERARMLQVGR